MMSAVATVFTGPAQTGESRMFAVAGDERARWFDTVQMLGAQLYGRIRSVRVNASPVCDTRLFLFSDPSATGVMRPFQGRYVQIVNPLGGGAAVDVDLAAYGFDQTATSALLVSTYREPDEAMLSARESFDAVWRSRVVDAVGEDDRVRLDGRHTFRWAPTEPRPSIDVTQRLSVERRRRTYPATATLRVTLSLESRPAEGIFEQNVPKAQITEASAWVGSGSKSGTIRRELADAIEAALPRANAAIGAEIDRSGLLAEDLFVLPGVPLRVRDFAQGDGRVRISTGNTTDDATIVADGTIE